MKSEAGSGGIEECEGGGGVEGVGSAGKGGMGNVQHGPV
jgi:hypothetical protein